MSVKKTSQFSLQLKNIDKNGYFAGYASVFGVEDNHNDIILSGAFKKSLSKKATIKDIKLLWQHKADEPIGIFTKLNEDAHGLYVEGKLLLEVQRTQEAYSLMKNGALRGLSIGFIVKKHNYKNGIRLISEADLWEISLVTFPANELAEITDIKSADFFDDEFSSLNCSIAKAIEILKN